MLAGAAPPPVDPASAALERHSGRASGRAVYEHVTIVDARSPRPRPDMAIVVDGERIARVMPAAALTDADRAGARIHDGHGRYAIPGLVDTHQHLGTYPDLPWATAELTRSVYGGVTATRDMAGDARVLGDLARSAWLNLVPAADLYYSALVAGPDFFADPRTWLSTLGATAGAVPWMQAVTPATDLTIAVAMARGTSATGLKIYANLDGALVRALIAEAHRQKFPVWTHLAVYPATPFDAVGADAVSHVCMLGRYVLEPGKAAYGHQTEPDYSRLDPSDPVIVRYGRALAAAGTVLDATLSVYPLAAEAPVPGHPRRCSRELAGRITATLVREGVMVSTGTDATAAPDDPFPAVHGEIANLVRYAGFTPWQALAASTLNSARVLGLEHEQGTIEPGKYASFALYERNPADDVANLKSIVLTVKRGREFPRADYHHVPIVEPEP